MPVFTKADFYYGAFLSLLINRDLNPVLIDNDRDLKRRRYSVITNIDSFEFYCKYSTSPSINKTRWDFPFSPNETDVLIDLVTNGVDLTFAFICYDKNEKAQELAIVSLNEFLQCVELNTYKDSTPRFSLVTRKHSPYIFIYGNKLSDNNALAIKRNGLDALLPSIHNIPESKILISK